VVVPVVEESSDIEETIQ